MIHYPNYNKIRAQLKMELNDWQKKVSQNNARFKTIVAGRRSGKTFYVAYEEIIVKEFFKKNKNIWIVAPNYDLTQRVWDELYSVCVNRLRNWVVQLVNSKGSFKIKTVLNTVIEAKSADDPQTLVGKGIDLLIIDEAGKVKAKAWKESLMPTLIDRHGRVVLIGTPKGKNWFYEMYMKGQDGHNDYASWRYSSYANNTITKEEIDSLANEMDETEKRQEILAEFIEGAGQVFRNINNCIKGIYEKYKEGCQYVMGIDLAKHQDFTVIKIGRVDTKQVVFTDRFNQLDWSLIKTRIKLVADKYNNPFGLIDSTGVGDPIFDDLTNMGLNLQAFKFTTESKNELVKGLAVDLENENIFIPAEDKNCIAELEYYQYEQMATGKFRYGAPEGLHDDDVTALMLMSKALMDKKEPQLFIL